MSEINKNSALVKQVYTPRNTVVKILSGNSEIFRDLVKVISLDEIISNLDSDLITTGHKEDDWADEQHMDLKQLTITRDLINCKYMPKMLQYQLSELRRLHAGHSGFAAIMNVIMRKFREGYVSRAVWIAAFKKVSISVKKNCDRLGNNWYCLTDLELLVGYNLDNPLSVDERREKLVDWSQGEVDRGPDSVEYYRIFESEYDVVIDNAVKEGSKFKFLSVRDFIPRVGLWMTDGSSRGAKVVLEGLNGEKLPSLSKKQVLAVVNNSDELEAAMFKFNKNLETYSITEKIEPGLKKRVIVSAHHIQQLRMSYIEHCIKSVLKKAFPKIFFLKDTKAQVDTNNDLIRHNVQVSSKDNTQMYNFPLDASNFDWFVSGKEIRLSFKAIRRILSLAGNRVHPDVFKIMDQIELSFFNGKIYADGKFLFDSWDHGVPSGVRWTGLLDSMINGNRFAVCKKVLARDEIFGPVDVLFEQFMGDDMSLVLRRLVDSIRILRFYQDVNIPIHPLKNFLSFKNNEFLRRVYIGDKQTGYPNRMITKFMFRLPEKSGASNNRDLVRERVVTLFKMSVRASNMNYFWDKTRAIFLKVYKLSNERDIVDILSTSNIYGGFAITDLDTRRNARHVQVRKEILWDENSYSEIEAGERNALISLNKSKIVKGVYKDQSLLPNRLLKVRITDNKLETSVMSAINPLRVKTFGGSISIKSLTDFKVALPFSLKYNFSTTNRGKFRPWMSVDEWQIPSLPDLVDTLINENKLDVLLSITHEEVKELYNIMLIKCEPEVFTKWIRDDLPKPSAMSMYVNSVNISVLLNNMYNVYFTRLLSSRNKVTYKYVNDICFACFQQFSMFEKYLIKNKFVFETND